ncbi:hypothetical protein C9374_009236 [Naegleria lovaniensis]|uniref:Calpain catalytic domain-containing protein n=1 Tax=Naegleria lovaniensis TaxID=51637 RepID=A0AA88GHP6_NAELO|nr:uncharacterized protein C9374_009236 [Naegleria lovaniensis]KAG2377325.1 hypothetical protein C9374_009236 [Naegleria lovaniensis]
MFPYQPHQGVAQPYSSPQDMSYAYQGLSHHEQQHQQHVLMMQQQQQLAPGQVVVVQTTTTTYHQQPVFHSMQYGGMYSDQYSMMTMNQNYEPPQSLDQLPFFSSISVEDKKTDVAPVLFNFDNLVVDALVPNYLPAYCVEQQNDEIINNNVVNNSSFNTNTNVSTVVNNVSTTNVQNNTVNNNQVNTNVTPVVTPISTSTRPTSPSTTTTKQTITNVIEKNTNLTINNTNNVTNQVTNVTNVTSKVVPSSPIVSCITTNTDKNVSIKDVKKEDKVVKNTTVLITNNNTSVENKEVNKQVIVNEQKPVISSTTTTKAIETNTVSINNNCPTTTTTTTQTTTSAVSTPTKEIKNTISQKTEVNSSNIKTSVSETNINNNSTTNKSATVSSSSTTTSNICNSTTTNMVNNVTNVVNNVVNNTVVNNKLDERSAVLNNTNSQTNETASNTKQEVTTNTVNIKNIHITNNINNTTNDTVVNNVTNTVVNNITRTPDSTTNTTNTTGTCNISNKNEANTTKNTCVNSDSSKCVTVQQTECPKPQRKWVIETTIENFKSNFSHLSGVSPLYLSTLTTLEKYQTTLRKTLEMATGENVEKFTALAIQCDTEFEKSIAWLERTIVMLEREKIALMNWTENKSLPNFLNMTVEQLIEQCKKLPSHPKFDESVKTLIDYFQRYGKLVQYLVLLRYYYTSIHKKYDPPKIVVSRTEKCGVSKMYNDNDFDHTWDALKSTVSFWLRPCQFSDKPVLYENDSIDVKRIRKGFINNAYFISAVHAVGQKCPEAVKRRFVEIDFVSGRHTVKLFKDQNHEKFVTIDDSFPIEYLGKPIATSSSCQNEFWPHILEKAYAKLLGGYHMYCHGGSPSNVLQSVFGCSESLKLNLGKSSTVNEIWTKLQQEQSKGSIMLVYTNSGYNENTENDCHAYVVQQIVEIKDNSNVVHKLIKLFNPWGLAYASNSGGEAALDKAYALMEWKGRYSDGDSNWNDYLIKNLNIESKNDGVFWMCCEDFCSHWSHLIAAQLPAQE